LAVVVLMERKNLKNNKNNARYTRRKPSEPLTVILVFAWVMMTPSTVVLSKSSQIITTAIIISEILVESGKKMQ